VTSESFSTVILSFDSKVETRSSGSSALSRHQLVVTERHMTQAVRTYVKPLISLNSCVILPPLDSTSFLAFSKSSCEASGLRVTCGTNQSALSRTVKSVVADFITYVVLSRHLGYVCVGSWSCVTMRGIV
jgi:hypothetical protein